MECRAILSDGVDPELPVPSDHPYTGLVCRACKKAVAVFGDKGLIRCPACGAIWDAIGAQPART
jgi:hypothetical protein